MTTRAPKRWPIDHTPTFHDLAFNLTFACNLSCVGCDRASFLKPQHSPPMTLDRLREIIEELKSAGIETRVIRIVGGEPTLHPDFLTMAQIIMDYASSQRQCTVRLFSNKFTQKSRDLVAEAGRLHPRMKLMGAQKMKSWVFPAMTRYEYVSPTDAGSPCNWPCPNMGGRGKCGSGVDQLGFSLCPTAGPIDTILGLGARATSVKQMLQADFVRWQSETICSHCGNFMDYQQLPQLWECNGTPVSEEYKTALDKVGYQVVPCG